MNLALANVEEFYLPAIQGLPSSSREGWRRASELVAGSAFYWGEGDRFLVLPAPLGEAFSEELGSRLGAGGEILAPERPEEALCGWFEARLGEHGVPAGLGGRDSPLEVLAWGQTWELCALVERLASQLRAEVAMDCGDRSSLPLVAEIDSKVGLRHLLSTLAGGDPPFMPEGFVAENLSQAARLVGEVLPSWGGCLVKADRSAAGWGIVSFDGAHPPRFPVFRHLSRAARGMPELNAFPLVVERLVRREGGAVSVSAQGRADGMGGAVFHFCAQHLDRVGSARVGRGIMALEVEEALAARFTKVAALLSELGYRGVLGIDFALDGEGKPLLLEVNPRRTTLTAAFDGARRLGFGGEGEKFCALYLPEVGGGVMWEKLPPAPKRLLYPIGGMVKNAGWLPLPAPGFGGGTEWRGALVFAENAEAAGELAVELNDALDRRR